MGSDSSMLFSQELSLWNRYFKFCFLCKGKLRFQNCACGIFGMYPGSFVLSVSFVRHSLFFVFPEDL